jgi:hypothetical protein
MTTITRYAIIRSRTAHPCSNFYVSPDQYIISLSGTKKKKKIKKKIAMNTNIYVEFVWRKI